MIRVAVLDDYQNVASTYADWSTLGPDFVVTFIDHPLGSIGDAAKALANYDVVCLMRERMPLPAALIEQLPRLKLIIVTGARTRSIDQGAAAARGIPVAHTDAGDSRYATPELAWGLILASARHLQEEGANIRAGGWQKSVGTTLAGKVLGLLGVGKMGSRMATIARAFEMQPIGWSPNLTIERAGAAGVTLVDKQTLFRTADFLSIHLVLSAKTEGIVGASDLSLMKRGATLVNTSRGALVDEGALIARLRERAIFAALDVYEQEPLPLHHPLRELPHTTLSPHLGYVTDTTYRVFYTDIVKTLKAWRAGEPIRLLPA
jgi:D-3-phosphoglycerate dehydrogenase